MQTPINTFKQALQQQRAQIGLWLGLADSYCAEIIAGTGYGWLLIDGEHAPNDVRSVLWQLQAIASATSAFPGTPAVSQPVVRLPHGDTALIKQYLDIGAQTLLVPMVDTAEQAAQLVNAMRYPPAGVRGMGAVLAAIDNGIARILAAGKAPGILSGNAEQARKWLDAGALFVAVGIDTQLLSAAAKTLLGKFKPQGRL